MIREFHQISLRGRNSFGVDQRAARLVEFETAEDLRTFFAAGIPGRWTVLAGGNNILFTEDYDGVLLTPVARQIALLSDDGDEVRLRVEAGVEWDDLVEWAVERGLWGIENLSLIPGKAGSAPVQNIGAYGCEAKDAIRRVEMYCVETGNLLTLDAAHCGFGYRERVASIDRGKIVIAPIAPDDACLTTVRKGAPRSYCGNSVLYYEYCDIDTIKNFGVPENIAQIDADRLQFPLTLRRWRDGDWFVPFGMTGRKKVSDFLVDAKVSVAEKQRQFVLLSGDEIVWLVGRRIDDRYRLTPDTENVLRITKEIV